MDVARWWSTNKALASTGTLTLRRGLPRTHHFAQARSVLAVARHRCDEVFNPPGSVTLWRLPQQIEEVVDTAWEGWLDGAGAWKGFFDEVAAVKGAGLTALLTRLGLVSDADVEA